MRKANTVAIDEGAMIAPTFTLSKKATAPRILNAGVLEKSLFLMTNGDLRNATNRLQNAKENERQARAYIVEKLAYIRNKKEETQAIAQEMQNVRVNLSEIDKARTTIANIKKLKWVQSVRLKANGSAIVVHTRAMFVDVRNGDGERETTRRCIGAFDIIIKLPKNSWEKISVTIRNTVFSGVFSHWAIKRGTPCLGSYQEEYTRLTQENDIYGLLDMFFHYLHSTDDGSAWRRSHTWVQNDRIIATNGIRVGDRVSLNEGTHNGEGYYIESDSEGIVTRSTFETVTVSFEDTREDEDGETITDDFEATVPRLMVRKIDDGINVNDITATLARLDALPNYASLEDCMAIIKKRVIATPI